MMMMTMTPPQRACWPGPLQQLSRDIGERRTTRLGRRERSRPTERSLLCSFTIHTKWRKMNQPGSICDKPVPSRSSWWEQHQGGRDRDLAVPQICQWWCLVMMMVTMFSLVMMVPIFLGGWSSVSELFWPFWDGEGWMNPAVGVHDVCRDPLQWRKSMLFLTSFLSMDKINDHSSMWQKPTYHHLSFYLNHAVDWVPDVLSGCYQQGCHRQHHHGGLQVQCNISCWFQMLIHGNKLMHMELTL